MLAIVVVADLVVLVLFSVLMQLGRVTLGDSPVASGVLPTLVWEIGGALSFGSLVGALLALYLRYVARESHARAARRVCAPQPGRRDAAVRAAARGDGGRHGDPNIAVPQGDALKVAIQRGALPVLIVFFVAVGTSLQLDVLAEMGTVALALVLSASA